jgi:hypothetical protein
VTATALGSSTASSSGLLGTAPAEACEQQHLLSPSLSNPRPRIRLTGWPARAALERLFLQFTVSEACKPLCSAAAAQTAACFEVAQYAISRNRCTRVATSAAVAVYRSGCREDDDSRGYSQSPSSQFMLAGHSYRLSLPRPCTVMPITSSRTPFATRNHVSLVSCATPQKAGMIRLCAKLRQPLPRYTIPRNVQRYNALLLSICCAFQARLALGMLPYTTSDVLRAATWLGTLLRPSIRCIGCRASRHQTMALCGVPGATAQRRQTQLMLTAHTKLQSWSRATVAAIILVL